MDFEILVEFRKIVEREVCENRRQGNKHNLIYIETRYKNFETPFIYIYTPSTFTIWKCDSSLARRIPSFIYAYGVSLLRWCKAGFRGAPPLEEFEDSIGGFGDISIVCESLTRRCRKRVQQVQVEVVKVGWSHQKSARIEHDGIVNMGILALGQHCIRVVVYKEDGGQELRLVCP